MLCLNRVWVQTGSMGIKDFIKQPRVKEYDDSAESVNWPPKEIGSCLGRPRVVILLRCQCAESVLGMRFGAGNPSNRL